MRGAMNNRREPETNGAKFTDTDFNHDS
jgi:hypothetical protein